MQFALVMFIALLVTGAIALWDRLYGRPQRQRRAAEEGAPGGADVTREPVLVEYARAFFPVILIVFILRSFVVEPFRIPSGSMLPGLLVGDFIMVNKFAYGVRLPIINNKVFPVAEPARGDVVVFRFPHNTSVNYIKRIIGLPGDRVVYENKRLYVNGKATTREGKMDYKYSDVDRREVAVTRMAEMVDGTRFDILLDEARLPARGEFQVPNGHYFVMGDNRDHSNDSRYWGYVSDDHLVGKAFLIWFSWNFAARESIDWSRIGTGIR